MCKAKDISNVKLLLNLWEQNWAMRHLKSKDYTFLLKDIEANPYNHFSFYCACDTHNSLDCVVLQLYLAWETWSIERLWYHFLSNMCDLNYWKTNPPLFPSLSISDKFWFNNYSRYHWKWRSGKLVIKGTR
jgi:hypothetical protein